MNLGQAWILKKFLKSRKDAIDAKKLFQNLQKLKSPLKEEISAKKGSWC